MVTLGVATSIILCFLLVAAPLPVDIEAGIFCVCGSYADSCTPSAALPDGSRLPDHCASHSMAFAVLHAMLGPPGTVNLAEFYNIRHKNIFDEMKFNFLYNFSLIVNTMEIT